MYNGFGTYPQDDMGVNSYFGESDTNFFGDTSNDSFFGEGCGFTGVGNGEFFNESVGFSADGSEVISEAYDIGFGYSNMFTEASNETGEKGMDSIDKLKRSGDNPGAAGFSAIEDAYRKRRGEAGRANREFRSSMHRLKHDSGDDVESTFGKIDQTEESLDRKFAADDRLKEGIGAVRRAQKQNLAARSAAKNIKESGNNKK